MKIDALTKEVTLTESEYNELVARECLTPKKINMKREDAIKNVLSVIDGLTPNFQEAIRVLIPELAETNDEKFESYINEACQFAIKSNEGLSLSLETTKRLKDWLEKQKEQNLTMAKSPQINQQPSWSSKDQQILQDILGTYVYVIAGIRDKGDNEDEVQLDSEDKELLDSMEKEMDWLKSLPKRLKR